MLHRIRQPFRIIQMRSQYDAYLYQPQFEYDALEYLWLEIKEKNRDQKFGEFFLKQKGRVREIFVKIEFSRGKN